MVQVMGIFLFGQGYTRSCCFMSVYTLNTESYILSDTLLFHTQEAAIPLPHAPTIMGGPTQRVHIGKSLKI